MLTLDGTNRAQLGAKIQDLLSELIGGILALKSANEDRYLFLSLHQSLLLDADLSLEVPDGRLFLKEELLELLKSLLFLLGFTLLEGFGFLKLPEEFYLLFLHVANLGLQGFKLSGKVLILLNKFRARGFMLIVKN